MSTHISDSSVETDSVIDRRTAGCYVCGFVGEFELRCRSPREGFLCPGCRSSLRYQHQAQVIVDLYGGQGASTLRELAGRHHFRGLSIFEPGLVGPFRRIFADLPDYQQSYFWEGVAPGESQDGVRCENLESLTLPAESVDLMITSDIFEHVRRPWTAFASIFSVLRPGGRHVMSIPVGHPQPAVSVARVDTSSDEDTLLMEPIYHGSPRDPQGSLVYTDFGADLPSRLLDLGYEVSVHHGHRKVSTYVMRRPVLG